MGSWTPAEWAAFFTALGTLVTAVLAAVAALMANIAKLRSEANTVKIDENTALTKKGTEKAADNAKKAEEVAAEAKTASQSLQAQFNGTLDQRITTVVKTHLDPLTKAFEDKIDQDEKNTLEVRNAMVALQASVADLKKSIENKPCP